MISAPVLFEAPKTALWCSSIVRRMGSSRITSRSSASKTITSNYGDLPHRGGFFDEREAGQLQVFRVGVEGEPRMPGVAGPTPGNIDAHETGAGAAGRGAASR